MLLIPLVCMAVVMTAAPKKTKAPRKQPPKSALADVKRGDFVEYDIKTSSERALSDMAMALELRAPMRLRIQAVEVTEEAVVVEARAVGKTQRRWLMPGVSFRVLNAGLAPEGSTGMGLIGVRDETAKPPPQREVKRGDATFHCVPFDFDNSRHDGPRGSGCASSPDVALQLGGGIVDSNQSSFGMGGTWALDIALVAAGNAPVPDTLAPPAYPDGSSWTRLTSSGSSKGLSRTAVSSAGGKLVISNSDFDHDEEKGTLTVAGLKWLAPRVSTWSTTVLAHLVNLLDEPQFIHTVRPELVTDGLRSTVGPIEGATKQVEVPDREYARVMKLKPEQRLTFYARPETLLGAPLLVRFGALERTTLGADEQYSKIVEWK